MIKKELYKKYNREEIHNIFSPETIFTPSAGTWGLQGLIRINKSNNFVFLVTEGTVVGEHEFDEGFTEGGLFRWQSQPKNTLSSSVIIDLINHNETTNSIHLFYRNDKTSDYSYLGKLKYVNHDNESGKEMKPVNFNWQLLDWPIPGKVLEELDIKLEPDYHEVEPIKENTGLIQTDPPKGNKKNNREGVKKAKFKFTEPNNPEVGESLKELGEAGEELVFNEEKKKLEKLGMIDLANNVEHISLTDDGAGYDILSFDEEGNEIFIEVKTTKNGIKTDFFISPGEMKFSEQNKDKYFIYRVYNYDTEAKRGNFYIKKGSVAENFELSPTGFKVSILA